MAIGITEPTAELLSTSNATSYQVGAAFTPSANATLVVLVAATDTTATGTVSGGGLTWTKKDSLNYSTTDTLYLFWANTGASPASCQPTFDCTGDAASGAVVAVLEYTGSDVVTADPIRQVAKNTASSTANPTCTFPANLDTNNGYAYIIGSARTTPAITPPASWTETVDGGYSTPAAGAEVAYRAGGETGTTLTTTATSHTWGMLAFEVYVSGAGPSSGGVGPLLSGGKLTHGILQGRLIGA